MVRTALALALGPARFPLGEALAVLFEAARFQALAVSFRQRFERDGLFRDLLPLLRKLGDPTALGVVLLFGGAALVEAAQVNNFWSRRLP